MDMSVELRQAREREFWNQHYATDMYRTWTEKSFGQWCQSLSTRKAPMSFLGAIRGKRLLLCGVGPEAVVFARAGAEVYGFDISEIQIEAVRNLARRVGLRDHIHVQAMSFEQLHYPDAFFDLAYGAAILHHVDLVAGAKELRRVLKPGARAAFIEPLGTNPLLEFARHHLPYREKHRTADERPLNYRDIERFTHDFASSRYSEFSLLAMLRRRVVTSQRLIGVLEETDKVVLGHLPWLGRFCSQIWIGVEKGGHPASKEVPQCSS
jgi:SAM-dependent methyltransferase